MVVKKYVLLLLVVSSAYGFREAQKHLIDSIPPSKKTFWSPPLMHLSDYYVFSTGSDDDLVTYNRDFMPYDDNHTSVYSDGVRRTNPNINGVELRLSRKLCELRWGSDIKHQDDIAFGTLRIKTDFTAQVEGTRWDVETNRQQCLYNIDRIYDSPELLRYIDMFDLRKSIPAGGSATYSTHTALMMALMKTCGQFDCESKRYNATWIYSPNLKSVRLTTNSYKGDVCRLVVSRFEAAGIGKNVFDVINKSGPMIGRESILCSYDFRYDTGAVMT